MSTTATTLVSPPASAADRRTPAAIRSMLALLGGFVALAFVAAGAWTLLDLSARHTFDARASYGGVRSLVVDASSGDVRLTPAPAGAAIAVTAHVTEGLSTPHRQALRPRRGTLSLKASCSLVFSSECNVDYDITVPRGVAVHVHSGAGDVRATGLTGSASIFLESGDGDVKAEQLRASNVTLSTGAGDVEAQFVQPPTRLIAQSGDGDVRLTVPDVVYAVKASSGAGSVSDRQLRIDPSAPRSIDASSGAGDVSIGVGR